MQFSDGYLSALVIGSVINDHGVLKVPVST